MLYSCTVQAVKKLMNRQPATGMRKLASQMKYHHATAKFLLCSLCILVGIVCPFAHLARQIKPLDRAHKLLLTSVPSQIAWSSSITSRSSRRNLSQFSRLRWSTLFRSFAGSRHPSRQSPILIYTRRRTWHIPARCCGRCSSSPIPIIGQVDLIFVPTS